MSSELSSDDPGDLFIIHEAADAGDVEALRQLLQERSQALEARRQQMVEAGEVDMPILTPDLDHYIQGKDQSECTPLHIALLRGHVECARCMVEAGADVQAECDGCPALILAVCTAALPGREPAALQLVQLLLEAGADPMQRDDGSRLALHWAAELGLVEVSRLLLAQTAAAAAQLREQMEAAGETAESIAPMNVLQMQDMHGNNPLHCAARADKAAVLAVLLETPHTPPAAPAAAADQPDQAAAAAADSPVSAKNKETLTPLAVAAFYGAAAAAELLLKAHPPAAGQQDRHGFNPATLAARRGFASLAAQIQAAAQAAGVSEGAAAAAAAAGTAAAGAAADKLPTLIVAPPQCEKHLTCPDPLARGVMPPPENVERLRVLVEPGRGILRCPRLAQLLAWELDVAPAPIADILRVHDWNYVRKLQAVCHALKDRPDEVGYLDADTAVSFHTFEVALRAAAAVCLAVDRVVAGQASNAFCAVRPPGHHSGPRGIVPSKKDPTGSHGFCLLNNLAIGAAYAMNVHRHRGIQRVALLDFDVHHGNGTRACVSNTAPSKLQVPFSTPMSEGVHIYNTYQPWFDSDDDDNILFASVQGYGPKSSTRPDVFVYPGSGATTDTQLLKAQRGAQQAGLTAAPTDGQPAGAPAATVTNGPVADAAQQADAAGSAAEQQHSSLVEEDPDQEFPPSTADEPPLTGPRIIEVGIKGPGAHPTLWRRAWRDKILPAVVNFNPDLILVSAGFDAHRKDVINYRYIGVTEADYEWLTDQIVQVANRCCNGRVVSVLEGGYNINGGLVSAFARSVEAHVRGLAQPHSQVWDPEESRQEREQEHRRKEERARRMAEKKAAALARLARMEAAEAAAAATAAAADGAADGGAVAGDAAAAPPVDGAAAAAEGSSRLKRRRTASVDYQALNAQLEAAAAARAPAADAPAGAEADAAAN